MESTNRPSAGDRLLRTVVDEIGPNPGRTSSHWRGLLRGMTIAAEIFMEPSDAAIVDARAALARLDAADYAPADPEASPVTQADALAERVRIGQWEYARRDVLAECIADATDDWREHHAHRESTEPRPFAGRMQWITARAETLMRERLGAWEETR